MNGCFLSLSILGMPPFPSQVSPATICLSCHRLNGRSHPVWAELPACSCPLGCALGVKRASGFFVTMLLVCVSFSLPDCSAVKLFCENEKGTKEVVWERLGAKACTVPCLFAVRLSKRLTSVSAEKTPVRETFPCRHRHGFMRRHFLRTAKCCLVFANLIW